MVEADRSRFAAALNWLAGKYPLRLNGEMVPRRLPREDLHDWFLALRDVHIERVEWAVRYHYGHSEFFPGPAKIREWAALAPPPTALSAPKGQRFLPDTPPDVARNRLQALFDGLNDTFGTKLKA